MIINMQSKLVVYVLQLVAVFSVSNFIISSIYIKKLFLVVHVLRYELL